MAHEKFHYESVQDVRDTAEALGVHLPLAQDTKALSMPLQVGGHLFPNRLGVAPMEGADAQLDGSPSSWTRRRYLRLARGGSALIWMEAVSIVPEGRSSLTQLYLCRENLDAFRRLTEEIREEGLRANGFAPYLVMQANHSGRYSNPDNRPAPLIAYRHPELEKYRAADDSCIVTDEYLDRLTEKFGEAAEMAREAGFDAVDIKSCHGYLLAELSSAYTRPGRYGGSLENRTRLLREGIRAAKAWETKGFRVTARLGIYDGYPRPYGFGVREGGGTEWDPEEPVRLVRALHEEEGLSLINLTMGNPYATTHVTRPFDRGKYVPDEHPFVGLSRMIQGIGTVRRAVPGLSVWASAPSYLRFFADLYAAGAVEEGLCDGMLFGRLSFADPDFANEILHAGRINPEHVCLTCGLCGDLIRAHLPTGCVVRDAETYRTFYREYLKTKDAQPANFRG